MHIDKAIRILKEIKAEDKKAHVCIDIWQKSDVAEMADDLLSEGEIVSFPSNEEINIILDEVDDNIDCEWGVTWGTFRGILIDKFGKKDE